MKFVKFKKKLNRIVLEMKFSDTIKIEEKKCEQTTLISGQRLMKWLSLSDPLMCFERAYCSASFMGPQQKHYYLTFYRERQKLHTRKSYFAKAYLKTFNNGKE